MYRFHNQKVDTNLYLQLEDLAVVLSDYPKMNFEFNYGAFVDIQNKRITASTFWDTSKKEIKQIGYKTDLYLRAIGTLHHSSMHHLKQFAEEITESAVPKFGTQLVTLLEDLRMEEVIKRHRPGTARLFSVRRRALKNYFSTQLKTNVTRSLPADELFCLIYLLLQADSPEVDFPTATSQQLDRLESLKSLLYSVYEAKTTREITSIATNIVFRLSHLKDMVNEYTVFPISQIETIQEDNLFDELTRTDPLANQDQEEVQDQDEFIDQRFSTWHRENKNDDRKQLFLQFELESGTKTSLLGGEARETEEGDQAAAQVQGTSGKSKQKDYSKNETLDKQHNKKETTAETNVYGEENKFAQAIPTYPNPPSTEDIQIYEQYVEEIEPLKRKLEKTIEKTIEHKKNEPRTGLAFGRLSKKLLPIVLEDNPRIFYKKDHDSKQIDAVFTLLIDCSASMHNKMEETKKGVVLFHEVLKSLQIPHSIVGFWEDAMEASPVYQPNYFHIVHSFSDSLYHYHGPKIMQLEPEEDNRDGFSIRIAQEMLLKRSEKNKFLLVFSDGEPAAANYSENGLIDTNEAVTETKKKGIEVIGHFIADGELNEQQETMMQSIYGKEHMLIPDVAELPGQFAPLLKRLLLKLI